MEMTNMMSFHLNNLFIEYCHLPNEKAAILVQLREVLEIFGLHSVTIMTVFFSSGLSIVPFGREDSR
jgi:hypothetical protein